jgi:hypothetical protein
MKTFLRYAAVGAALVTTSPALAGPILGPNDPILAIDRDGDLSLSNYPAAESPDKALDGDPGTKYLNFGKLNTGLMVTPVLGPSIIQSMVLTTANDAPERDPASWAVYGTNDNIDLLAPGVNNGDSLIANWQLIAQGNVALPATRLTVGPVLSFANTTSYSTYRILFPTVKDAVAANSMQVANIDLFSSNDGSGTTVLTPVDTVAAFQLPARDSRYNANQAPKYALDGTGPNLNVPANSSSPANEAPPNTVDGTNNKYLNFGAVNSGFIVTPASGAAQVRSFTLTSANDAPERDPAGWQLFGTNSPITSPNNSHGDGESWTLIDSGTITLPDARNTLGDAVTVNNSASYSSYKMLFTGLRDATTANSMQIAEASFFTSADGTGTDILNSGDSILGIDADTVTGLQTKYLNFGNKNSGVIVTPSAGAKAVTGFQITTADDATERDPASYEIYGTNSPIISGDNSQGNSEPWTLISSGALTLPDERMTEAALVSFANATSYTSYKLVFPTLKQVEDPANPGMFLVPNSMQISGLQLFDSSVAKSADFNEDGRVDGADFLTWQRNLGATGATKAMGDATGDGLVNAADLTAWKGQFATAVAAAGAVPEPGAVMLVGAALAGLGGFARRRQGQALGSRL